MPNGDDPFEDEALVLEMGDFSLKRKYRKEGKKTYHSVTGQTRTVPKFTWLILLAAIVILIVGLSWTTTEEKEEETLGETVKNDDVGGEGIDLEGQVEDLPPPQEEENNMLGGDVDSVYKHQKIANQQVESFQNGDGLLLNVIITHNGATTVRSEFGVPLKCPSFVCLNAQPKDGVDEEYPEYLPWSYEETDRNVKKVREYFQFLMWQFGGKQGPAQIADTNWEHPDLVSMLVIREPLSRSLAGDGIMSTKYPMLFNGLHGINDPALEEGQWWEFAHEKVHTNNFALRTLTNKTCCNGADTPREYLDMAKELVQRFTFVIDIDCLQHSLEKVAEVLGFEPARQEFDMDEKFVKPPIQERIPYRDVYDFLVEKNQLDTELYEFAKGLAVLDCDAMYAQEAAAQEEAAAQQQEEEAAAQQQQEQVMVENEINAIEQAIEEDEKLNESPEGEQDQGGSEIEPEGGVEAEGESEMEVVGQEEESPQEGGEGVFQLEIENPGQEEEEAPLGEGEQDEEEWEMENMGQEEELPQGDELTEEEVVEELAEELEELGEEGASPKEIEELEEEMNPTEEELEAALQQVEEDRAESETEMEGVVDELQGALQAAQEEEGGFEGEIDNMGQEEEAPLDEDEEVWGSETETEEEDLDRPLDEDEEEEPEEEEDLEGAFDEDEQDEEEWEMENAGQDEEVALAEEQEAPEGDSTPP